MKCQNLFSEKKKKHKKNISNCRLLKFLPRALILITLVLKFKIIPSAT